MCVQRGREESTEEGKLDSGRRQKRRFNGAAPHREMHNELARTLASWRLHKHRHKHIADLVYLSFNKRARPMCLCICRHARVCVCVCVHARTFV